LGKTSQYSFSITFPLVFFLVKHERMMKNIKVAKHKGVAKHLETTKHNRTMRHGGATKHNKVAKHKGTMKHGRVRRWGQATTWHPFIDEWEPSL
jgi:hypothetical protein